MGRSEVGTSAQEAAVVVGRRPAASGSEDLERRRILDAMVETVSERGYVGTEINEVLRRAGVTPSVFARQFAGKEECFVETINDAVGDLERAVAGAWPSGAEWPERVRLGLRAFVRALVTDPARTRLAMVEAGCAGPAATLQVRSAYQRFVPYFDEGREEVAHDVPAPTSDAIVGGIAQTVQHHVASGDIAGLSNLLPDLVYFALVPYLGHRRAAALAVA
jgi:AcrR family transcriptional regulator